MPRVSRIHVVCVLVAMCVSALPAPSQEVQQLDSTLDALAAAIREAGYARVGVAPSFITLPQFAQDAPVVTSPHGLYFTSLIQAGLVERRGDAFEVIDADILAAALRDQGIDNVQNLDKLRTLAEQVGGLDALVIGKQQWTEQLLEQEAPIRELHLECKLLDVGTGNVQATRRDQRELTLADEIYAGESIEVLRRTPRGLLPIGVSSEFFDKASSSIPLHPRAASRHFNFMQPHPIPNPNCPYRVTIYVESEPRQFVYHPRLPDVYVAIEPGETFFVKVQNTTSHKANVAVFVDGFNILDRRRELPDEKCAIWSLAANGEGRFRGFYDRSDTSTTVAPFVMKAVEDSVAMEQGFTDLLGMITVVLFDNQPPNPQDIYRRRNAWYFVSRQWNDQQQKWDYREDWGQIVGAPQGVPPVGVGTGRRQHVDLGQMQQVTRGPILAGMTIRYATQSMIDQILKEKER